MSKNNLCKRTNSFTSSVLYSVSVSKHTPFAHKLFKKRKWVVFSTHYISQTNNLCKRTNSFTSSVLYSVSVSKHTPFAHKLFKKRKWVVFSTHYISQTITPLKKFLISIVYFMWACIMIIFVGFIIDIFMIRTSKIISKNCSVNAIRN